MLGWLGSFFQRIPFSIDTSRYFEDGSLLSSAPRFFLFGGNDQSRKCQNAEMCIYNSWVGVTEIGEYQPLCAGK